MHRLKEGVASWKPDPMVTHLCIHTALWGGGGGGGEGGEEPDPMVTHLCIHTALGGGGGGVGSQTQW